MPIEQEVLTGERRKAYLIKLATEVMGWAQVDPVEFCDRTDQSLRLYSREAAAGRQPIVFWPALEIEEASGAVFIAGIADDPVAWDPFDSLDSAFDLLHRIRKTWTAGQCSAVVNGMVRMGLEVANAGDCGIEERSRPMIPFFTEAHHVAWSVLRVLQARAPGFIGKEVS